MYKDIGKKIKGLAKAIFVIEAVFSLVIGIILMAVDEDMILAGLLVLVVGAIMAWVSSWFLYGFGELVDKTCDIERNTRGAQNDSISDGTSSALDTNYNYIKNGTSRTLDSKKDSVVSGKCEMCNKEDLIYNSVIKDSLGTRYRKLCEACITLHNANKL